MNYRNLNRHMPQMHVFNGQLTAIIQASEQAGKISFTAKAKGLKDGLIEINTHL